MISLAATKRKGANHHDLLIARYDVSVAFFHAESSGGICVIPPVGMYDDPEVCWLLLKAMNGTREASLCFGNKVRSDKLKYGFNEVSVIPGAYYHPVWDVVLTVHGDDFLAVGRADDLRKVDSMMRECYKVKILPKIGPPSFGGEVDSGSHLHRLISWSPAGFTWSADTKYVEQLTIYSFQLTRQRRS